MAAMRPGLGVHRDYPGSVEDINGLSAADDQKLSAGELNEKIEATLIDHADALDAADVRVDIVESTISSLKDANAVVITSQMQVLAPAEGTVPAVVLALPTGDAEPKDVAIVLFSDYEVYYHSDGTTWSENGRVLRLREPDALTMQFTMMATQ